MILVRPHTVGLHDRVVELYMILHLLFQLGDMPEIHVITWCLMCVNNVLCPTSCDRRYRILTLCILSYDCAALPLY